MRRLLLLFFPFTLFFSIPTIGADESAGADVTGEEIIIEDEEDAIIIGGDDEVFITLEDEDVVSADRTGDSALEEESESRVQEIVIAAAAEEPVSKTAGMVAAQVTVIEEDEIRAAAPRSAADIVAPVMGVQVDRYGGAAEPAVISIRGSSPEQVLVLVNGRRLNSAQGGGVDLSTINPDDIARVEVIRGGASALYGENAMGGVVNIITKDGYGEDSGVEADVSYGSFDTVNAGLRLRGSSEDGKIDGFLSASGMLTEGGYSYADEYAEDGESERENSDGKSLSLSAKAGFTPSAAFRTALTGQVYRDEKGVPGLVEFPTTAARMADTRYSALLSSQGVTGAGSLGVDISWIHQNREYEDPDYFTGAVKESHSNNALSAEISLSRSDSFGRFSFNTAAGYSFRYDHLDSTALLQEDGLDGSGTAQRFQHSGYLRSSFEMMASGDVAASAVEEGGESRTAILSLFPALRYDWNNISYEAGDSQSETSAFSFNLGLLLPLDRRERFTLKANVGTAYRVPSFDDLFWSSTAFAVGNPDLAPEEALCGDLGLIMIPFPGFTIEAVLFDQEVTNLIQWSPGPSGQWTPGNIGSARLLGGEFEARGLVDLPAMASMLELKGNCSLLHPVDLTEGSSTTGLILARKARVRANAAGTLSHPDDHFLRIEGRYVGERFLNARNTLSLDDYFVLDGTANWQITEAWNLLLSVKNLLDAEYVDLQEYPIPGIEFTIETGYSL